MPVISVLPDKARVEMCGGRVHFRRVAVQWWFSPESSGLYFQLQKRGKKQRKIFLHLCLGSCTSPSLTAPTIPTFGIMVILTWYNMARLPSSGSPCVELALILQGMMDFSSETVRALASFPYRMRIVGALLCGD